jgi:hypothetical protein
MVPPQPSKSSSAETTFWFNNDENVGDNGLLVLNTFPGTDHSAPDKLVVNGGTAIGAMGIRIHNIGGPGAEISASLW